MMSSISSNSDKIDEHHAAVGSHTKTQQRVVSEISLVESKNSPSLSSPSTVLGFWVIAYCMFVFFLLVDDVKMIHIKKPQQKQQQHSHGNIIINPSFFVEAWIQTPPTIQRRQTHQTIFDRMSKLLQMSSSSSPPEDDVTQWLQQAQKLRDEINALEESKSIMEEEEKQATQVLLDEKRDYLERYSATIPILKPDGETVMESVTFPPRLINTDDEETDDDKEDTSSSSSTSKIITCEASLPLGMILGEHESLIGMTAVDEILEGSNAEKAGIQVGDLLRGVTACRMEMDTSNTWQLMAGGIGRPKTVRFMFSTDDEKFETVMEAVGSNRFDPQERPVVLVFERLVE